MRRLPAFAALAALLCLAGCGRPTRLPVVPAQGKVLYRGTPPVGAEVLLVPVNDESPDSVKPRGTVGADGVYRLTTYPRAGGEPDGAPPGAYRVSLRWSDGPPAGDPVAEAGLTGGAEAGPPGGPRSDRLRERYSNPKTSGLSVTVDASGAITPAVLQLN